MGKNKKGRCSQTKLEQAKRVERVERTPRVRIPSPAPFWVVLRRIV